MDPPPTLSFDGAQIERVARFVHLGSCVTLDGYVDEEISVCIRKAQQAFANLSHLLQRRDIRLTTKGHAYADSVCPVLYALATWLLRSKNYRKL